LRHLLGQYLQQEPKGIHFEENPNGKPFLATSKGRPELFFNLAHSQEMGLFGFSKVGELGVDVERIKDPYDGEKLAGRYFSSQESAYLSSVAEKEKARTFFRLWTLKEAYLKAMGLGFSGGLDTFSVKINQGAGTALLSGRHPEDRQGSWNLKYFEVDEAIVGALAAPEGVEEIQYFDGNKIQV
jgi:4'-phosphopantetheinyl transferase